MKILKIALLTISAASAQAEVFSYKGLGDDPMLSSRGIALADLDGDGDIDAYVANDRAAPNQIWINDGVGNFTNSGQMLGANSTMKVALADLDGDGDIDAFAANYGQSNIIWINDGVGNFTNSGQMLGANSTMKVTLADLDGDGDIDAFAANYGQSNIIWINDGLGNFIMLQQSLGAYRTTSVALGDIDNDGDIDAFTTVGRGFENEAADRVWLNDGVGLFTDSGQLLEGDTYSNSRGVALADFDGDDDLDAVVARNGSGSLVWINNGSGSFSNEQVLSWASINARSVSLSDLDGDGDYDIYFARSNADQIFKNDGQGRFSLLEQSLGFDNMHSNDIALADLDGDDDIDAFAAGDERVNSQIYFNVSDPAFTSVPPSEAIQGIFYNYKIEINGDRLSNLNYTYDGQIGWLVFDEESMTLSGIPTNLSQESASLTVIDSDHLYYNLNDTQSINIDVFKNDPPEFTSTPELKINEDIIYQYKITYIDDYQAAIAAKTLPSWLTFDAAAGLISGTPSNSNIGRHDVEISITDEIQTTTQGFSLNVMRKQPEQIESSNSSGGGSFSFVGIFLLSLICSSRFLFRSKLVV
ncbi:MAG: hypothetical protein ACI9L9_001181 [Marivirga sp.]|jgi:hypothetical protein